MTWPLFWRTLYLIDQALLSAVVIILMRLHLSYLRRGFRFIMAKKCMGVANKEADKVEKINYLTAGLSWYNKYLKRNLDLELDETRFASNIILSSSNKDPIVETIEKSFSED